MPVSTVWELTKATFGEWYNDEAPRLGASLAYYAIFSLAPLLIIVVAVVGFFYKDNTAVEIQRHLESFVGAPTAGAMSQVIRRAGAAEYGGFAALIGVVALFIGATAVFSELRAALNKIWEVPPSPTLSVWAFIKDRIESFFMVLAIAVLLVLSMVLSAVLSTIEGYFSYLLPGAAPLWYFVDLGVSVALITLLFAALFRYAPDRRIPWPNVWMGAAVTAVLFVIGKFLIGLYLGQGTVGSAFGAAGSALVILAWVYYSSQIVFLGAEFTQIYNRRILARKVTQPPPLEERPAA